MNAPALRTIGLGKSFALRRQQAATRITDGVLQACRSFWQPRDEQFWALRDVNLEIQPGEVVGLIGLNGAGKSTLLKLLSRILHPTTGRMELRGRVGSLLEVGTGFHPELTGRENIFLNGAVLGMSRAEIERKFDAIVDFSEVSAFLDLPVKRYSSGMTVRLAFAVAAHLEPEIMLVDEVLAVGDVRFQKKCLGRLQDLAQTSGRTIVLVSHNPASLSALCDRGLLLEHGQLTYDGSIQDALKRYQNDADALTAEWKGNSGDDDVRLCHAWVRPQDCGGSWDTAASLEIGATIEIQHPIDGLVFGFRLHSEFDAELVYSLFDDAETGVATTIPPGRLTQKWRVPANTLASGQYRIAFEVGVAFQRQIHQQPFGELQFRLDNFSGIGRRYPVRGVRGYESLLRPDWMTERIMEPLDP